MSDLEEKAADILDKIEKLTIDYAPEIKEAALASVQISGLSTIIYSIVGIVCGYIIFKQGTKLVILFKRKSETDVYISDSDILSFMSSVITVLSCTLIFILSVFGIFDIWAWVAMFNPELALVHKITDL